MDVGDVDGGEQLIKDFLSVQPKKCENCGALNPKGVHRGQQ